MTFLVISCHRTFHNSTFIYELIQNVFVWKKKLVVLSIRLYTLRTFLLELRFYKPVFSN